MELKWLTRQMILAIHGEAIVVFGGLPGISLPDRFLTHFKIDSEERWAHRLRQAKRPTTSGDAYDA